MTNNIFQNFKKNYYKNKKIISPADVKGETVEYCGCMLSKWISVQFQKIISDKIIINVAN